MSTHPKGSVQLGGTWYTPTQIAALKKAGTWQMLEGLYAPLASTGTQILLPNTDILTRELQREGLTLAQAKAEALKWGLKPLKIPTTGLNGATIGIEAGLKVALDGLPPEILRIVESRLGFNDTALGKTLNERIAAVLPVLQAAQGHIGNIDLKLALANATVGSLQKVLGQYVQALSSGNSAALIGATASAKYSAEANADSTLTNWGIDTPEVNRLVSQMVAGGVTNVNEILQNIRQTATYQKAFAGLAEYNKVPGHVHMTEQEYRSYSQAVLGAAQQYGNVNLNQNQIGQLLKGNVSAAEFQQRVMDIGAAVANADQGTKDILKQWYGIDASHLFAYYANPKEALPDMQRAVASGEIEDYAQRIGFGGLTKAGASQLADMAKLASTQGNSNLGYGVGQIESSLLGAARDTGLSAKNPGAGGTPLDTNTLIGSVLPGFAGTTQVQAQTQVARAEQAAAAPFEKGGGYEETQRGVIGLGAART